ncbi:MAG: hypothetical protein GXP19_09715 [Gammaproteobacteria bacterium]|nr:hypothetical protein [Gammaproteobacteria bacterium]
MFAQVLPTLAAIDDPTRPPGLNSVPARPASMVKKGPRWVLSSTLVSPERRAAVINDRVVVLGDRVAGATVVKIEPSTVHLRSGGNDVTLVLLKKNVKTLSRQPIQQ